MGLVRFELIGIAISRRIYRYAACVRTAVMVARAACQPTDGVAMPIFAERVLDDLAVFLVSLRGRYLAFAEAYVLFPYKTERGKEYGHGYARRFKMMNHCVQRVFQLVPPEQDNSPEEAVLLDATVCVQSFIMNVFGALDNLAWIWVSERPLQLKKWTTDVGLGQKCEMVRATLSPEMHGPIYPDAKLGLSISSISGMRSRSPHTALYSAAPHTS